MCDVLFPRFWLSVPVQLIAWKDSSPNDLLCVEWDVKSYTLTHPLQWDVCVAYLCRELAGRRWHGRRRDNATTGARMAGERVAAV